jgi:hypothetical protein
MNLEEKRSRMLSLVSDWRTSGLTQETFSAQDGIKSATFSYWVSRSKECNPATSHFITLPSGLSKVSSQVEILYPNGVRVKVDQDLALIAQLIRL